MSSFLPLGSRCSRMLLFPASYVGLLAAANTRRFATSYLLFQTAGSAGPQELATFEFAIFCHFVRCRQGRIDFRPGSEQHCSRRGCADSPSCVQFSVFSSPCSFRRAANATGVV